MARMQWCSRPGPRRPCAISKPRPSPSSMQSSGTRTFCDTHERTGQDYSAEARHASAADGAIAATPWLPSHASLAQQHAVLRHAHILQHA